MEFHGDFIILTIDEAEERHLDITTPCYIRINGEAVTIKIVDKDGNVLNKRRFLEKSQLV